jgi:hypothetical protein
MLINRVIEFPHSTNKLLKTKLQALSSEDDRSIRVFLVSSQLCGTTFLMNSNLAGEGDGSNTKPLRGLNVEDPSAPWADR